MLKLQYSQQSGLPPLWSVQSVPAPEVGLSIKPISVLESLVANSPALRCRNLFLLFGNGKANQVTRVAVRRSLAGVAAGVLGADPRWDGYRWPCLQGGEVAIAVFISVILYSSLPGCLGIVKVT